MADRPERRERAQASEVEPDDPALAIAARHALHDEELIAAFAADGDAAEDAARAQGLVERCQACSELYTDLAAIGGVLRAMPNAADLAATRRAPRDFRLSVGTANRLRPGSVVLRFRDRLREAIASLSRPLGMSMASLGVVGLLLGTLTLGGGAGTARTPEDNGGAGAANVSFAPGATAAADGASSGPGEVTGSLGTPNPSTRTSFETLSNTSPAPVPVGPTQAPPPSTATSTTTLVVVASIALLIGGVGLLVAGSRRREPIPGR